MNGAGSARAARRMVALVLAAGVVMAGMLAPGVIGLGELSAGVGSAPGRTADDTQPLPDPTQFPLVNTVLDRNGTPIAQLYDQYRLPVTFDQISRPMDAAVVAIEDRRFFDEGAIDPQGVLRAVLHDGSGDGVQGGSTITQQYVKNFLINVVDRDDPAAQQADRAATLSRKLGEAELAVRLAHSTSKADILAGYLNVVEFTGNVYGVGAAAQAYFGTTAAQLSVPQAALLAGMVNNPNLYNPYAHPQAATQRRDLVIDAMVADGSLSAADGAAAKGAPLGLRPDGPVVPGGTCMAAAPDAGFFCQYALGYLQQAGLSADQLATGGYTIHTTMDPVASRVAKDAVSHNVATTAAGVANTFALIRPGSDGHDVLAMVSNRDYGTDAAAGQRAGDLVAGPSNVFGAGSEFKIFTTAAALEKGTVGYLTPLADPDSDCFEPPGPHASCYPVHNDNTGYPDPISLQDALATSPNVAFVGLEARTGMPAVLQMAERLGLRETLASNDAGSAPVTNPSDPRSDDPQYNQPQSRYFQDLLSFTLGNSPVSTLEMANVSATILSGGTWCPPNPIVSVTDRNGAAVPVAQQPCQQVISTGLAHTLSAGLSADSVSGTSAAAARAAGWTRPDIGKTGTTNASESVAYMGGVDGYAGASMVFADGPHPAEICPGPPVHLGDCGDGAFGGTVAAPPFFATLSTLLAGQPDTPVPAPDPAYLDPGARTVVPYVVGQDPTAAAAALDRAGYPQDTRPVPGYPPGRVLGQSPQGNVAHGTRITLFVGSGP